jgi:glycosyltransferase involved in cell wall biosynthesis
MNVVFVVGKLSYWGASKSLARVANYLSQNGLVVSVITCNGEIEGGILDDCINTYSLTSKPSKSWLLRNSIGIISNTKKITNLVKKLDANFVISFGDHLVIPMLLSKLFTCSKYLVSERNNPYKDRSALDAIQKKLYRFSNGMVFQTNGAKNYYKFKHPTIVIPNIVDDVEFSWKGSKNIVFVSVARLQIKEKRQDILIKAFRKVIDIYKEAELHLYGDGTDQQHLIDLTQSLQLEKNIIFKGVCNDVYKKLENCTAFVLSSESEGIPNSLAEAMSVGCPVISTDCEPGGARLLIDNGHNGILVPKNDTEALSDSILKIIQNPIKAKSYGIKAKEIVVTYSEGNVLSKWIEYLNQFGHKK